MENSQKHELLVQLFKMSDFIAKGGTLKLLKSPQRFGKVGDDVLNRLHGSRFNNVLRYTTLPRGAENPHIAVGSLMRNATEKLAEALGVKVKKGDQKFAISKLDIEALAKIWDIPFISDIVELKHDKSVGMFNHGSESFIIGELCHSIVFLVQAVKNMTFEQHEIVEKMFDYAFNTPGYMEGNSINTDVIVNLPHWVECGYHKRSNFVGYQFAKDTASVGYQFTDINTFSGFNPISLPIEGEITLAKAS